MAITVKDFAIGRKTFFICPDMSLFPENYLEEYFSLGYECYFVENLKQITLHEQVQTILEVFKDVILIFNIDAQIPDIKWVNYIQDLQKANPDLYIGVTFVKRADKDVKPRLERIFNFDIGLKCGCVQLEYHKNENFWIIQKILYASQAQGRRKTIRALCSKAYTFTFEYSGKMYDGCLSDISLSHFSFIYPVGKLPIKSFEKIMNIQFHLKGLLLRADALLVMQREVQDGVLNVFSFLDDKGANGLSNRNKSLLLPNLYNLMANNYKIFMDKIFEAKKTTQTQQKPVEDIEINL